jgi:hypothetical protein
MTAAGVYWFYAAVSGVVTVAFVVFLMPETRGKQFEEIAKDFGGGRVEREDEEEEKERLAPEEIGIRTRK